MSPGTLLLASAVATGVGWAGARRAPLTWLGASLASCACALAAAIQVLSSGVTWEWRASFALGGQPLHLRLDGLSAIFLALLCVVGGAGAVYARGYWTEREHPVTAASGRRWWSALLLGTSAVLASANGLHLLIAWEAMAVAAFFLITLERQRGEVRRAGWLYLAASHAGTLALFAFFALLAQRTGSWELGPMRARTELAPLFWLALLGFGVKAGMFPLHVWLPSAHSNAPSHVSAILSGVMIKVGIYGIARFSGWLPTPEAAGWVMAALGAAGAVLGAAFALGQHDLKRMLAYLSVENVGIVLIGLGFARIAADRGEAAWGQVALAGSLLHVWNHGLLKALLFLGAGSVLHATGTREPSRLGGLWRKMPWTAALFGLGALGISGLPPLNAFVSELVVYLGLFDAVEAQGAPALAAAAAIVLLAASGALALACYVGACGVAFLGAPRSSATERAHECGAWMRAPMIALAAACVALGLAPFLVWPALQNAVEAWGGAPADAPAPEALASVAKLHVTVWIAAALAGALLWRRVRRNGLKRALTWDCGYAAPTARMQYTTGSFAAIVTEWFGWILRPELDERRPQGIFPQRASRAERTPETVLERVVEPAGRLVLVVARAARRLQHGRVQAYVFYLIVGLAAVAALTLTGGGP